MKRSADLVWYATRTRTHNRIGDVDGSQATALLARSAHGGRVLVHPSLTRSSFGLDVRDTRSVHGHDVRDTSLASAADPGPERELRLGRRRGGLHGRCNDYHGAGRKDECEHGESRHAVRQLWVKQRLSDAMLDPAPYVGSASTARSRRRRAMTAITSAKTGVLAYDCAFERVPTCKQASMLRKPHPRKDCFTRCWVGEQDIRDAWHGKPADSRICLFFWKSIGDIMHICIRAVDASSARPLADFY
jgi:hypothetical protein